MSPLQAQKTINNEWGDHTGKQSITIFFEIIYNLYKQFKQGKDIMRNIKVDKKERRLQKPQKKGKKLISQDILISENFQQNLIQNSKFVQSTVILPLKDELDQCPRCRIVDSKLSQLLYVSQQVSELKQKNHQLYEQIELLHDNFKYILQLVSENIKKNIASKLKTIVREKQEIIQGQQEYIEKLKNQLKVFKTSFCLKKDGIRLNQELQRKNKYLQSQNEALKNLNKKYMQLINTKSSGLSRVKSVNDFYDIEQKTKDLSHEQQTSLLYHSKQSDKDFNLKSVFRIKRKSTFEKQGQQQNSSLRHINSLSNLRYKLNNIKQQMQRSDF